MITDRVSTYYIHFCCHVVMFVSWSKQKDNIYVRSEHVCMLLFIISMQ